MIHVYEFEIFPDEGMYSAIPFDMEGGTCGSDFDDACFMAGDWLRTEMEQRDIRDEGSETNRVIRVVRSSPLPPMRVVTPCGR